MGARFAVYQHLTVHAVSRAGSQVQVLIADPSGTPQRIHWSFDDVDTARERVRIIERWRQAATRLTYVTGRGESALVDDAQLFRLAYVGPAEDGWRDSSAFG